MATNRTRIQRSLESAKKFTAELRQAHEAKQVGLTPPEPKKPIKRERRSR